MLQFRRFAALTKSSLSEQHLELRSLGLGATSAETLVRVLKQKDAPQLAVLELEGNSLGDRGAMTIATLLHPGVAPNLVWLGLGSNGIGLLGGVGIANALKVNKSLTALDLSSASGFRCRNMLGRKSNAAMVAAIAANPLAANPLAVPTLPPPIPLPPTWRAAPTLEHPKAEGADGDGTAEGAWAEPTDAIIVDGSAHAPANATPPLSQLLLSQLGSAAGGYGEIVAFEPVQAALSALCDALETNPLLAVVRLGGNALGVDGARLLAERIGGCKGLAELGLANNDVLADGAEVPTPSPGSARASARMHGHVARPRRTATSHGHLWHTHSRTN